MKKILKSKSGFTLVEIVVALTVMFIMVTGFATLFSFAVTTVYIAGQDAKLNANARTETDNILNEPANPGGTKATANITWNWNGSPVPPGTGDQVQVIHEHVNVDGMREGSVDNGEPGRGTFDVFRRIPDTP